jgi:N-acetylmuramic acid 6-phosphate (MurNAc-6-P) etherase
MFLKIIGPKRGMRSFDIDRKSALEIAAIINNEDKKVPTEKVPAEKVPTEKVPAVEAAVCDVLPARPAPSCTSHNVPESGPP